VASFPWYAPYYIKIEEKFNTFSGSEVFSGSDKIEIESLLQYLMLALVSFTSCIFASYLNYSSISQAIKLFDKVLLAAHCGSSSSLCEEIGR